MYKVINTWSNKAKKKIHIIKIWPELHSCNASGIKYLGCRKKNFLARTTFLRACSQQIRAWRNNTANHHLYCSRHGPNTRSFSPALFCRLFVSYGPVRLLNFLHVFFTFSPFPSPSVSRVGFHCAKVDMTVCAKPVRKPSRDADISVFMFTFWMCFCQRCGTVHFSDCVTLWIFSWTLFPSSVCSNPGAGRVLSSESSLGSWRTPPLARLILSPNLIWSGSCSAVLTSVKLPYTHGHNLVNKSSIN